MTRVFSAAIIISMSARKAPACRRFPACVRMTISSPRTETTAICLARGAEPKKLFAEILGRADGLNKGKGGSFHSVAPSLGFLHSSGVVAGIIPLSTGTAYAAKAQKNGRITVCLFGDGSLEEGAAPEAFNLASLYKLPVLFLCENNGKYGAGRAVAAAQSSSMAAYPLTDLPKAYKIPAQQIDGMDAGLVHATISEAVEKIRRGEGPQFVEAQTVRYPGSETNWPTVPQPTETSLAWDVEQRAGKSPRVVSSSCDPLLIYIRELVEAKQATKDEIAAIDHQVKAEIARRGGIRRGQPLSETRRSRKELFCLRADYARTCLLRSQIRGVGRNHGGGSESASDQRDVFKLEPAPPRLPKS